MEADSASEPKGSTTQAPEDLLYPGAALPGTYAESPDPEAPKHCRSLDGFMDDDELQAKFVAAE